MEDYIIEQRIIKAIPKMALSSKSYILAHESGNANNTGDNSLEQEVKYMTNHWQDAFTHFWVGNKKIVQLYQDGLKAWGAGAYLNPHSPAQVELARVDTQAEFDESYKRYVWLLRYMAQKHGIPVTLDSNDRRGIKTHLWVSNNLGGTTHTDPYGYLASWGISKAQFKKDIEKGMAASKPVTDIQKAKTHKVVKNDTLWGISKKYGVSVTNLKKWNELNSDLIIVGDLLVVAEPEKVDNKPVVKPAPTKPAAKPQATGDSIIKGIQANVGTTQDGWDGPDTRKGVIKLFQRGVGTPDDGIVGPNTLNKAPVIRSGSQGWHVYAVQAMLYLKGYKSVGKPDKIWGSNSIQACKNYQKDNGLGVDGTPGRNTYAKLMK